jgi:ribonucleoside-triphosphate reductase
MVDGKEVNLDSAVSQLEVYKMLMDSYCQQNVSCTISYSVSETDDIVNWLHDNWDSYVAVSFLFRNDPSKSAADLGYPYLPQEVTTKEIYEAYVAKIQPLELDSIHGFDELLDADDCATGACPVK